MITSEEREKERTDVLWAITKLWSMYPDLRFGQLIDVFSETCTHSEHCAKLFYKTDKDMAQALIDNVNKVFQRNIHYEKSLK